MDTGDLDALVAIRQLEMSRLAARRRRRAQILGHAIRNPATIALANHDDFRAQPSQGFFDRFVSFGIVGFLFLLGFALANSFASERPHVQHNRVLDIPLTPERKTLLTVLLLVPQKGFFCSRPQAAGGRLVGAALHLQYL